MIASIFTFILEMISNIANMLLAPLNIIIETALNALGGADLSAFDGIVKIIMDSSHIIGYVVGSLKVQVDLLLALVLFYGVRKNYNKILSSITFFKNIIKNFKII